MIQSAAELAAHLRTVKKPHMTFGDGKTSAYLATTVPFGFPPDDKMVTYEGPTKPQAKPKYERKPGSREKTTFIITFTQSQHKLLSEWVRGAVEHYADAMVAEMVDDEKAELAKETRAALIALGEKATVSPSYFMDLGNYGKVVDRRRVDKPIPKAVLDETWNQQQFGALMFTLSRICITGASKGGDSKKKLSPTTPYLTTKSNTGEEELTTIPIPAELWRSEMTFSFSIQRLIIGFDSEEYELKAIPAYMLDGPTKRQEAPESDADRELRELKAARLETPPADPAPHVPSDEDLAAAAAAEAAAAQ